ncbi:MAG: response regulator [Aquimarina sp.]|nr:response regulator [Aquimarina sp.]
MKQFCALLIDDDKATNFYNKWMLSKHSGFGQIVVRNSGVEGLEYLKNNEDDKNLIPDLILLDLNMPGMNGWEFLNKFKEYKNRFLKEIKIFILSTSKDPNDISLAKKDCDIVGYLNKPLSLNVLDYILRKHFQRDCV